MGLDCNKLSAAINSGCPTPARQYGRVGWFVLYDDVYDVSIADNYATWKMRSGMLPIYDRSLKPFTGTMVSGTQGDFYVKFEETVQFPVLSNSLGSAYALGNIKDRKVVVILEPLDAGGDYQVFGLDGGLLASSQAADATSDTAWTITLKSVNSTHAAVYLDADNISLYTEYDWIGYGIIQQSTSLNVTVDSDKTAYYVHPVTGVLTPSVAGVINITWPAGTGIGVFTVLIPKDTASFEISGPYLSGNVTTIVEASVVVACIYCTEVHAPNSTSLLLTGCTLSVQNIEKLLYELVLEGNPDGTAYMAGSNPSHYTWTAKSLLYVDMLTENGWTIVYN